MRRTAIVFCNVRARKNKIAYASTSIPNAISRHLILTRGSTLGHPETPKTWKRVGQYSTRFPALTNNEFCPAIGSTTRKAINSSKVMQNPAREAANTRLRSSTIESLHARGPFHRLLVLSPPLGHVRSYIQPECGFKYYSVALSLFCQCDHANQMIPTARTAPITASNWWKYLPRPRQFSPSFMPSQARAKHHGHDPRKV
jgi:hypothetical protein